MNHHLVPPWTKFRFVPAHFGLFRWISAGTESIDKCRKILPFQVLMAITWIEPPIAVHLTFGPLQVEWLTYSSLYSRFPPRQRLPEWTQAKTEAATAASSSFSSSFFLSVGPSSILFWIFIALFCVFFLVFEPSTWLGVGNDRLEKRF